MKKTVLLTIVIFMLVIELYPQTKAEWKVSVASPLQTGRYEDISFISPQQGWAVAAGATIIRTQDGGSTWDLLKAPAPYNVYFRSVALASTTKAFIGTLNSTYPLIVTPNSGKTFHTYPSRGKNPQRFAVYSGRIKTSSGSADMMGTRHSSDRPTSANRGSALI